MQKISFNSINSLCCIDGLLPNPIKKQIILKLKKAKKVDYNVIEDKSSYSVNTIKHYLINNSSIDFPDIAFKTIYTSLTGFAPTVVSLFYDLLEFNFFDDDASLNLDTTESLSLIDNSLVTFDVEQAEYDALDNLTSDLVMNITSLIQDMPMCKRDYFEKFLKHIYFLGLNDIQYFYYYSVLNNEGRLIIQNYIENKIITNNITVSELPSPGTMKYKLLLEKCSCVMLEDLKQLIDSTAHINDFGSWDFMTNFYSLSSNLSFDDRMIVYNFFEELCSISHLIQ